MRRALLGGHRGDKRHQPLADDDGFAGQPARHRRLRQHELRLARADQFDIDFGEQFGVEQRAVLGAARIVDGIARAQIVETV